MFWNTEIYDESLIDKKINRKHEMFWNVIAMAGDKIAMSH